MVRNSEPIQKIVILGGGTSGWLSANYLKRGLENVEITLVESSDVPPIGVGESTIPSLRWTFEFLGIKEEEWMPEVNATYKLGIKFARWQNDPAQVPDHENFWWHPFFDFNSQEFNPYDSPYFFLMGKGFSKNHYWHEKFLKNPKRRYDYDCFSSPVLCDHMKAPKVSPEAPCPGPMGKMGPMSKGAPQGATYAYHVDAGLLGEYFKKLGLSRGINHVVAHVADASIDEQGFVQKLITKDGREIEGDLFIDCSGFFGYLVRHKLGEDFLSDSDKLFCDSAIALQSKNSPEENGVRPFTTSTAASSGWFWEVPLYHRNGNGYVYSSQFQSPEEAEKELRQHLGPASEGFEAKHIKMKVGRNENFWVQNCVGIGLSSAFIEPLEATAIFIIEYQLAMLLTLFPDKSFKPSMIRQYNKILSHMYEDVRDFVVMHYYLSNRKDTPFWKTVHEKTNITSQLKDKMEFYQDCLPILDGLQFKLFRSESWTCLLAGMGSLPEDRYPVLGHLNKESAEELLKSIEERKAELCQDLPDHYHFLRKMYGMTKSDMHTSDESSSLRPSM